MKEYSAEALAVLESGRAVFVLFVRFDFGGGNVFCFNTSTWTFEHGGNTYYGAYGIGEMSPISDRPGSVTGVEFRLMGASAERVSLALDDANVVQRAEAEILVAILDPQDEYALVEVSREWIGYLDTMAITDHRGSSVITVTAESKAVDLLRSFPLTYSNADQQLLHPGDRGFEFVTPQSEEQVVWPDRSFFLR